MLPAHRLQQRVRLSLVRRVVDDRLDVAVPLPQGPRPVIEDTPAEPAQVDVTEPAAVDPHRRHALAVAVRRASG